MATPREPPVVLESKPLEISNEFESRRLIEEKIIAALKDENICTIGICGVGGVGKTTVATRIGEKVKREKVFDIVVMVTVGPSCDLKRIAYEISDYLGVKLEGCDDDYVATAQQLISRLILKKRILIILDDVEEILDLEKIGIPLQNKNEGSYKIMITSRFEGVCAAMAMAMGAHEIFTVQGLTEEEAWVFFRQEFGISVDSPGLYPLARYVAEKCGGSPLALSVAGRMLKDNSKLWSGFVVENNKKIPALSFGSASVQEMVAQGSFSHGRKLLDVPEAGGIDASFPISSLKLLEAVEKGLLSASSFKGSFRKLPPKRGQIKNRIFKEMMSLVADQLIPKGSNATDFQSVSSVKHSLVTPPKQGRITPTTVHDLIHDLACSIAEVEGQRPVGLPGKRRNLKVLNLDLLFETVYRRSMLVVLDLRDADIQLLPRAIKKLFRLRCLDLTNCRNLEIIEPGVLSSLVCLEELYMLGSFSKWEVEKEGEKVQNASINELESLPNLTALQIEIQDPNLIPKDSRIWSRLKMYVISTPKEIKCRFQESLHLSFPVVNPYDYCWQFHRAVDLHIPTLTSLVGWMCVMLRNTEYMSLAGDGSIRAVDELIPEGFKLLKQLNVFHCSTMEYLVNRLNQVLLPNGLFPVLESLCLEELPMFKEIVHGHLPVGLFGELRNMKLHKLPALLHVCGVPTQRVSLSNLRSVYISDCPKLKSLFSLSVAQNLMQLEEIKIEYCVMMEEIFSEERHEDGKISNKVELSKLKILELDTLPRLTGFCKNVMRIQFPQLSEICIQSLRELRIFCPAENDLPLEANGENVMQSVFNEKIAFGSLKKLEIKELDSASGIWCQHPNLSLFSELEVLVVEDCVNLRNLFSHSIAKVLVQLTHITVDDCSNMQEVVADDGEIGHPGIYESLLPRLKILELRRLPIERFCNMINDLELASLEDLTLYDCPEMKIFSGGRVNMPMLKCVKRDDKIYEIDGINNTVQRLFNERHLFVHQSRPIPSQSQDTELEEYIMEEVTKISKQSTGGEIGENSQNDMNQKDEDVSGCRSGVGTNADEGQKKEHIREAISKESIDTLLHSKRYVKDCILFCSSFPSDYEFTKDMLVWQWIAEGLVKLGNDEISEEVCRHCFNTLLKLDYIVPSGYDYYFDQMKYKVGGSIDAFIQEQLLEPEFGKYLDNKQKVEDKVERLSLAFKKIDDINIGILKNCSLLQTLVIYRCYGSRVKLLPSNLFLELKALKILTLSHSDITGLPSSVANLVALRYFDVSQTPITNLSESIHYISKLQTLKLDGCSNLSKLPRSTNKLVNLRHLILDEVRQLESMPAGIGKLVHLRTLRAFMVGEGNDCRIGELKNMNKLTGSIRILDLENVMTKEEAAEACLCDKHDLRKIELQWSDIQEGKNSCEEEILQCLRPPSGIHELQIVLYSGGMLPSWISDPSFSELVNITLYKCRFCDSLASFGELPSLKTLTIIEMNELKEINSLFCRTEQGNRHHQAFPKLEKLTFGSMSNLEKWTDLENGDFPHLRHVVIKYCPKFFGLPLLLHLDSLLEMEILYCPQLLCLPEGGLPPQVECLMIKGCPKLKERCCNEQCEDWSKVAHVPDLYIDNRKMIFGLKERTFSDQILQRAGRDESH